MVARNFLTKSHVVVLVTGIVVVEPNLAVRRIVVAVRDVTVGQFVYAFFRPYHRAPFRQRSALCTPDVYPA